MAKRNYVLLLRQIELYPSQPNKKYIIKYNISDKNNDIEAKIRSIIEVPYDNSDENEILFFKINVIVED